jgi:hypothetical protein
MKSDVLRWVVAAAIAVAIALGVWLFGAWFGGWARRGAFAGISARPLVRQPSTRAKAVVWSAIDDDVGAPWRRLTISITPVDL